VTKRDKEGQVVKIKARLVVRGCGQHPGDYLETHSPVVRLKSIHTILAIATARGLQIQQMDVKGAYLNGTPKEDLYMCQPDDFANGSGRVCHLIKTLYGLKQSGQEWNEQFNKKITKQGYKHLCADPCVYTRFRDGKIAIVTVWVNDLLLFADSAETIEEMKRDIHSQWETTDMGELNKIVRIEITQFQGQIYITQKQSI
jgi:hypothetical protein